MLLKPRYFLCFTVWLAGQLPNNFLLFTETTKNGSNIIRMDMTSYSYITIPLPGLGRPFAIDYDYINSKMYWTDLATKQIWSARVDGTQNRTVLALGASKGDDVAL